MSDYDICIKHLERFRSNISVTCWDGVKLVRIRIEDYEPSYILFDSKGILTDYNLPAPV